MFWCSVILCFVAHVSFSFLFWGSEFVLQISFCKYHTVYLLLSWSLKMFCWWPSGLCGHEAGICHNPFANMKPSGWLEDLEGKLRSLEWTRIHPKNLGRSNGVQRFGSSFRMGVGRRLVTQPWQDGDVCFSFFLKWHTDTSIISMITNNHNDYDHLYIMILVRILPVFLCYPSLLVVTVLHVKPSQARSPSKLGSLVKSEL